MLNDNLTLPTGERIAGAELNHLTSKLMEEAMGIEPSKIGSKRPLRVQ
jgi:hypothetical protein